jgi:Mg/Co/Ni transporter MgtE
MTQPAGELLQEAIHRARWDEAVAILQRLDPSIAADTFLRLTFEEQQALFRSLPVEFAAKLLPAFPYYHEYVLLHSRRRELRSIVDKMNADERMRFFDELPEEAWRHLMDVSRRNLELRNTRYIPRRRGHLPPG